MDFLTLASKVMEGREQWLSSSTTGNQVTISSTAVPHQTSAPGVRQRSIQPQIR